MTDTDCTRLAGRERVEKLQQLEQEGLEIKSTLGSHGGALAFAPMEKELANVRRCIHDLQGAAPAARAAPAASGPGRTRLACRCRCRQSSGELWALAPPPNTAAIKPAGTRRDGLGVTTNGADAAAGGRQLRGDGGLWRPGGGEQALRSAGRPVDGSCWDSSSVTWVA